MTTREENLKKINEELEAMSDEQLEEVAGGNISEPDSMPAESSKKLSELIYPTNNLPVDPDEYLLRFKQKPSDSKPAEPDKNKHGFSLVPEPKKFPIYFGK